ncbi:unnamed protein product [Porites evermanni]|uniref:Uncharacterized protein n=1 Tax=Porites evermanni TaxID=104178 RepID=A0ABN8SQK0_9CNID|nr:unnamed protein product [Porites evermanni]
MHQINITIERFLREKLALIPHTKLLITNNFSRIARRENIFSETLEVHLSDKDQLTTLLQLLTKRLETLDLISVMQELQRTFPPDDKYFRRFGVQIRENLSCVPRLQKTEHFL